MDFNFKEFTIRFNEIAKKGWIKGICNNHGNVGITFENEIGKKADSMYFPDYFDIEIKCSTAFSNYPLYLFTLAFDGPTYPEINRIIEKYGYFDKDFKNKKVLFAKISSKEKHIIDKKYYFKLACDYNEEKIYLEVYDLKGQLIERKSFVYFKSIIDHLYIKLNKMAFIKAYKKEIKGEIYFRYYYIKLLTIKEFDIFLKLLQDGKINVDLIARVNKSGKDKGRYRNKNLVFSIYKDKINELFNVEYELNYDKI